MILCRTLFVIAVIAICFGGVAAQDLIEYGLPCGIQIPNNQGIKYTENAQKEVVTGAEIAGQSVYQYNADIQLFSSTGSLYATADQNPLGVETNRRPLILRNKMLRCYVVLAK